MVRDYGSINMDYLSGLHSNICSLSGEVNCIYANLEDVSSLRHSVRTITQLALVDAHRNVTVCGGRCA